MRNHWSHKSRDKMERYSNGVVSHILLVKMLSILTNCRIMFRIYLLFQLSIKRNSCLRLPGKNNRLKHLGILFSPSMPIKALGGRGPKILRLGLEPPRMRTSLNQRQRRSRIFPHRKKWVKGSSTVVRTLSDVAMQVVVCHRSILHKASTSQWTWPHL